MHTDTEDRHGTYCIGITGGVGCGKSAVLDHLASTTDCKIIISDDEAKKLYAQGSPIFGKIIEAAGEDVRGRDGELDRKKLAERLFARPDLREKINSIVHPAVMDLIDKAISEARQNGGHEFLFVEAALLIECGYREKLDELWYVYASEEVRRGRLKENRGYSDEKITGMMASQLSEAEFRTHCVRVIDNNGSMEDMYRSADNAVEAVRSGIRVKKGN